MKCKSSKNYVLRIVIIILSNIIVRQLKLFLDLWKIVWTCSTVIAVRLNEYLFWLWKIPWDICKNCIVLNGNWGVYLLLNTFLLQYSCTVFFWSCFLNFSVWLKLWTWMWLWYIWQNFNSSVNVIYCNLIQIFWSSPKSCQPYLKLKKPLNMRCNQT